MNSLYRGLVLHLPLENIRDGQVIDLSGNDHNGIAKGDPQLVNDTIFGRTVSFDGVDDFVDPDTLFGSIVDTFTIEAWVKAPETHQIDSEATLGIAGTSGQKYMLWPTHGTEAYGGGHAAAGVSVGKNGVSVFEHAANYMPALLVWEGDVSAWTHIAVVYENKQPTLYVNARRVKTGQISTMIVHPSAGKGGVASGQFGGIGGGSYGNFKGQIAHVRLYDRALSEDDIRRDMQLDSARPMLHLKFDAITENKIIDASGNGLNAAINGNPVIIADEVFGQSLKLDGSGDYLTVADHDLLRIDSYTVEIWIKPNDTGNFDWQGIVGKPGRNYNIWLHKSGYIHHRFHVGADINVGTPDTQPGSILWDNWNHVAITNDGQTAKTYINGSLVTSGPTGGSLVVDKTLLIIGRDLDGNPYNNFKGQIADLRIYRGVLPAAAIKRDMDEDRAASASFHTTHPINFKLLNEDLQPVLLIDDEPAGHKALLEITNAARQALRLTGTGNVAPSPVNHHFELRFRVGTLADVCLDVSQPNRLVNLTTEDWQMSLPQRNGHTVSFYFASTKDRTVAPGVMLPLALNHLIADGGGGSRGTRLELHYQNLTYIDETTPLEGSWGEQLSIVNHRGKKNIPLHVGFLGSNTILNDQDKSESYLVLAMGNLLPDEPIPLLPEAESSNPSHFIILFDHEPNQQAPWQKPWALGTWADLKDVTVSAEGIVEFLDLDLGDWKVEIEGQEGRSTEITLTPKTKKTLAPGEIIKIPLQKIRSSLPAGHANIYLHYKNIPGYWDGQFVLTVEKGPLVSRGDKVGIGTSSPSQRLEVAGNIVGQNLSLARTNTTRGVLFLATTGDFNHALYNNYSNADGEGGQDSTKWNAYGGINIRVGIGAQKKTALAIDGNGNVGVGLTNPSQRLEVAGNIVGQNLSLARTNTTRGVLFLATTGDFNHALYNNYSNADGEGGQDSTKWNAYGGINIRVGIGTQKKTALAIDGNGNVGIGTNAPSQKLTVAGGHVQIDGNRVMGTNPNDKFTYDSKAMGHYSVGWFNDSWFQWGSTAWISGYGGFKFFTNGSPKLTMDYHGNIRYTTSLEKSSAREFKANIVELPPQEALATLAGLNPVKYTLKADEQKRVQLGFVAEEVPDDISSQDGKAINPDHIIAVLTRVVKEQQRVIQALEVKVEILIKK